ncbi:hypothetical protein SAMN05660330_04057 [Desulforhopalus singaporensis]|uniref:Arylsulfatase n=1 Tax=Desulforhopalus singaporensis TaxID=91360 RepID=A0A1H0VGK3_9BACT|nr:hypothetical protein SAMN05660330_04057 [Desulforhopalus singaporensis]
MHRLAAFAVMTLTVLSLGLPGVAQTAEQPNIQVIMADDIG